MKKHIIRSSNLALRFYRKDGWTREELEECLEKGIIIFRQDIIMGNDMSYWMLDIRSKFNIDKLMSKMSKLDRMFDDRPEESDREYLEKMNGWIFLTTYKKMKKTKVFSKFADKSYIITEGTYEIYGK